MPQDKILTATDVMQAKGQRKLVVITAYDAPGACWAARGGVDMILVGDSVAMTVQGRPDTNSVSLDQMIYHASLVVAAVPGLLVVGDLPFLTYETGADQALLSAGRYFRESGVRAVKLEGGRNVAPQVRALTTAGIPVMGHLGLTPQRVATLGGFKVQAKSAQGAIRLLDDALALQEAGCFAITLECVPADIAADISKQLAIPTIGIGAGPDCDGQVLVLHDLLGMGDFRPRFAKAFAQLGETAVQAIGDYAQAVRGGAFPAPEHCFSIKDEEYADWLALLAARQQ